MWNSQLDWSDAGVDQLTALPGPIEHVAEVVDDLLDSLDEDEPVGIDLVYFVGTGFGSHCPVGLRITAAPGGITSWLVMQVGADHRVVAQIALGQRPPLVDPLGVGQLDRVPEG